MRVVCWGRHRALVGEWGDDKGERRQPEGTAVDDQGLTPQGSSGTSVTHNLQAQTRVRELGHVYCHPISPWAASAPRHFWFFVLWAQ